jgi:amidase
VLAGPDGRDPAVPPPPLADPPHMAWRELRIAWAPTFPHLPVAAAIAAALTDLAAAVDRQGARVAEALPEVAWAEQVKLRGRLAKALLQVGGNAPGPTLAAYFADLAARDAAINTWDAFFADWDALLCPVAMTPAFPHTPSGTDLLVDGTPVKYWRILDHCAPFSLTGHPVVTVPVGQDLDGLPIGIQVVGRRWGEARLLAIAALLAEVVGPLPRWQPADSSRQSPAVAAGADAGGG